MAFHIDGFHHYRGVVVEEAETRLAFLQRPLGLLAFGYIAGDEHHTMLAVKLHIQRGSAPLEPAVSRGNRQLVLQQFRFCGFQGALDRCPEDVRGRFGDDVVNAFTFQLLSLGIKQVFFAG